MGSHQPLLWVWLWASGSEGPDPLEDIQPTAGQSRLLLLYRVEEASAVPGDAAPWGMSVSLKRDLDLLPTQRFSVTAGIF